MTFNHASSQPKNRNQIRRLLTAFEISKTLALAPKLMLRLTFRVLPLFRFRSLGLRHMDGVLKPDGNYYEQMAMVMVMIIKPNLKCTCTKKLKEKLFGCLSYFRHNKLRDHCWLSESKRFAVCIWVVMSGHAGITAEWQYSAWEMNAP